ncbi:N-acyl-D-amino-acid deacylase family protein [Actinophytocola sediminis]
MTSSLALTGGLVVDGTGAPGRIATVLVADGRIAAIDGDPPADARRVDVTGRVVCPGFVDLHTHSDLTLLSDPRALSKVHQGVTTEVVGNCGLGVTGPRTADLRAAVSYLDLDPAVRWTWRDLPGYLDALTAAGPGLNVATLVGHLVLHAGVCGFTDRPATPAELDTLCGLLADALAGGAVGLSTGLIYAPLPFVRAEELLALAEVTSAAGKIFTWHVRSYEDALVDSVAQAIAVARETGCRTQISHLAAVGRRNWGAVRRALDLVDAANADGCSVGVDSYPYLHGNAPLAQLLPAWAQEGGPGTWVPTMRDPRVRARISDAWQDRPTTWADVTISWTARPSAAVGHTVADLAGAEAVLDLLAEFGTGVLMTVGGRSEEDLRTVLGHPSAVVASDGLAIDPAGVTGAGLAHPRGYGCFPRYLARYAENLPDAIRRCTAAPAARIGLTDRGVLRAGAPADIVVFDPTRLTDRATFAQPHQFAAGIDLVLVNGTVTVERGAHTGQRAGHVLRT